MADQDPSDMLRIFGQQNALQLVQSEPKDPTAGMYKMGSKEVDNWEDVLKDKGQVHVPADIFGKDKGSAADYFIRFKTMQNMLDNKGVNYQELPDGGVILTMPKAFSS